MASILFHTKQIPIALNPILLSICLLALGCRSGDDGNESGNTQTADLTAYEKSPLSTGKSSLLGGESASSVGWQNWHQDLFRQADNERKVVCAMIGSGTDINTLNILRSINESPSLMRLMKNNHVNALVDSNLHPDMAFYATYLCLGSGNPGNTPILVWFSYEGSPISWTPIINGSSQEVHQMITRMSSTVSSMWLNSPEYTLGHSRNSQKDKILIPEPLPADQMGKTMIGKPILQAKSLFNPISNTVDNMGKLTVGRYLELMVMASYLPELSAQQRQQCLKTAQQVADQLLIRGLIDPLDGGVFIGKEAMSYALPKFSKTLRAQAISLKALYLLYKATNDASYLNAANNILAYTQKHHLMENGNYAYSISYLGDKTGQHPYLWTLKEIQAALNPAELNVATHAFGLRKLGNIPYEDDPKKIYFEKNSLTQKITLAELSERTSKGANELTRLLESIAEKLQKSRAIKANSPIIEKLSTAGSMALYTSACVAGYRVTGEDSCLDIANKTLSRIRDHFMDENGDLHRASFDNTLNSNPATGADYALACQAALDLHEATLDAEWLKFAHTLHTLMKDRLFDSKTGLLVEYDGTNYPAPYPSPFYLNILNLDNPCTWALAHSNAKRLSLRLADESFSEMINKLGAVIHQTANRSALSALDYLTLESIARSRSVYIKLPANESLLKAARTASCQIIAVTDSGSYPELESSASELKAGSCAVIVGGKNIGSVTTASELNKLLAQ